MQPKGYILDTLATAYWANGLLEEAVRVEQQAAMIDGGQRRFYQTQISRFTSRSYEDTVREMEAAQEKTK